MSCVLKSDTAGLEANIAGSTTKFHFKLIEYKKMHQGKKNPTSDLHRKPNKTERAAFTMLNHQASLEKLVFALLQ